MIESHKKYQGEEDWDLASIGHQLGCNEKNFRVYSIGVEGSPEDTIRVCQNTDTGNTFIAGDDGGNGCVTVIAKAETLEKALKIYEEKKALKIIYTGGWVESEIKSMQPISEVDVISRLRSEIAWLYRATQGKDECGVSWLYRDAIVKPKPSMDKKKFAEICVEIIKEFESTPV